MATEAHKQQIDELDAEIEAMEAQLSGQRQQPEGDPEAQFSVGEEGHEPSGDDEFAKPDDEEEATTGQEESDVVPEPTEQVSQQQPESEQVAPQPDSETGRVSWKSEYEQLQRRYTGLRQSSDHFKFEARQQIAALQEQLLSVQESNDALQKQVEEFQAAASQGSLSQIFSQEDIDVLGEGTVSSVQKAIQTAVEAATQPLQRELLQMKQKERDRLKTEAQSNRSQAYSSFRQQLGNLVPDFETINVDKGFIEWLQQPSPYSGAPRFQMFRTAERNGDVERVAQFFIEYKQTVNAPNQLLEEHVAPVGKGGSNQAPPSQHSKQPEVITWKEINQFYDDDIAGKYRGREKLRDELDKKYDTAIKSGRVR